MTPVARTLSARGWEILNLGYPSRHADIATLAAQVGDQISQWACDAQVDVVTHSLGGIVLRRAVAGGHLSATRVHRVVMLGPPNQGSELADVLPRVPIIGRVYRWFTGAAGEELGTGSSGIAAQLPAVPFELGVIAGTLSLNPWFAAILGGPSDGKVRVDRTRVAGMRDMLVVPSWHPALMISGEVRRQVMQFLTTGHFEHAVARPRPGST
jgi:hypothetical protein